MDVLLLFGGVNKFWLWYVGVFKYKCGLVVSAEFCVYVVTK